MKQKRVRGCMNRPKGSKQIRTLEALPFGSDLDPTHQVIDSKLKRVTSGFCPNSHQPCHFLLSTVTKKYGQRKPYNMISLETTKQPQSSLMANVKTRFES